MSSILENAIVHLLNDEGDQAQALFHRFMVERARQIHESLRQSDDALLTEGWDEDITSESYFSDKDLGDVEDSDDSSMGAGEGDSASMDDTSMGDDSGSDMGGDTDDGMGGDDSSMDDGMGGDAGDDLGGDDSSMGDDSEGGGDVEDQLSDIQDQLERLRADFEEIMGKDGGDLGDDQGGDDLGSVSDDMGDSSEASDDDSGSEFGGDTGGDDFASDDTSDDSEDDDSEMHEEAEEDLSEDDFDDISESIISELEKVSVSMNDGKEIAAGKSFSQNNTSPSLQKKPNPMTDGKPVQVKASEHKGFERETAPSVKDMKKRRNTKNSADDGRSPVSKEGDKSALINKDFGKGGEANTKSPLAKR